MSTLIQYLFLLSLSCVLFTFVHTLSKLIFCIALALRRYYLNLLLLFTLCNERNNKHLYTLNLLPTYYNTTNFFIFKLKVNR